MANRTRVTYYDPAIAYRPNRGATNPPPGTPLPGEESPIIPVYFGDPRLSSGLYEPGQPPPPNDIMNAPPVPISYEPTANPEGPLFNYPGYGAPGTQPGTEPGTQPGTPTGGDYDFSGPPEGGYFLGGSRQRGRWHKDQYGNWYRSDNEPGWYETPEGERVYWDPNYGQFQQNSRRVMSPRVRAYNPRMPYEGRQLQAALMQMTEEQRRQYFLSGGRTPKSYLMNAFYGKGAGNLLGQYRKRSGGGKGGGGEGGSVTSSIGPASGGNWAQNLINWGGWL